MLVNHFDFFASCFRLGSFTTKTDFRLAFVGEIRIKLDYLLRLPWLLVGLALLDEEEAREFGKRSLDEISKDQRPPPVHDVLTWLLLAPGSEFRIELEKFVSGVDLSLQLNGDCSLRNGCFCRGP